MFNSIIINKFFKLLEKLEHGSVYVTTPDGNTRSFEGKKIGANGKIYIHDWRAISLFAAKGRVIPRHDRRCSEPVSAAPFH